MVDLPACAHKNFLIRSYDLNGVAYCPDCDSFIPISMALNDLIKDVRDCIKEFNALDVSSISLRLGALEERCHRLEAAKHSHG